ncbi:response regulator [Legionella micdadei]|uniref:Response regulator receiver domain-containing protein n=1 Tax=Legionella micdadei TaxID=451 RepID=A0A098GGR4_LEGMI|nr:response regulator [Legionella micdadei]ARG96917.1 response regulator [Legionella micdadei]ARG99650.1 response regulator [Legionella micdadei]KTD26603.1 sensory histidine-kinase / response regulator [Legionella micdadei]NSL17806.1 response regulator [Legionella micdadei]CEG61678.1 Sensory box histidine kinase/response regulator [Legionella micdadei]
MTHPIHVLVVEDTLIAQMVAKAQLAKLGCLVDIASNGKIALEKTMTFSYDLILMDIGLGEGPDGFEVATLIKKQSTINKNTPIIAVTAHGEPDYAKKALAVGIERYFNKPFTPASAKAILYHLENKSLEACE